MSKKLPSFELDELRQRISMSQQLAKQDPDLGLVAGFDEETAKTILTLKWIGETPSAAVSDHLKALIKDVAIPLLVAQGKAYFASQMGSGELSHLGFRLGDKRHVERGTRPRTEQ